jgi:hypothetical protein
MTILERMKHSLLSRYGAHGGTVERKHLPPAVEEVVQHHHVNRIQKVIVKEDHEVHVEQSILPIIEDLEEEGDVQERTQAPQYKEFHHDMPQELVSKRMQNRQSMVDIGRNITEDDTQETVEDEPIVEHRRYIHTIHETQPVIRRRIRKSHVVHTIAPIFEKSLRISHIADLHEHKAITMAEWNRQQRQLENGVQSSDADGVTEEP